MAIQFKSSTGFDYVSAATPLPVTIAGGGSSSITTVGALNSGSITSGFGSIDIGADSLTAGAISGTTGTFNLNAGALSAGPTGTVLQAGGADASVARAVVDAFGNSTQFTLRRANGTNASKSALLSGDIIGSLGTFGYKATGYSSGAGGFVGFSAAENWTDTAIGTNASIVLCPVGSTAQTTTFSFSSAGVFTAPSIVSTGAISVGGSTPASASAAGVAGTITWDSSYIYVCTATNTWKRVAIATW